MSIKVQLLEMLEQAAKEAGEEINLEGLWDYAKERAEHLASCYGEPGFAEAVEAEADNVRMKAGIAAVAAGKVADAKLQGMVVGALRIVAGVLA